MLTHLSARAFKGLREFDIAPRRVNLLIGANGTGKTNFTDLVAFLAALPGRGLAGAFEAMGGLAQVRRRQPRAGTPYKLMVNLHIGEDRARGIKKVAYHFTLAQSKELKVSQERLQAVVYKRKPGKPERPGVPRFDYNQPIPLNYTRADSRINDWSEAMGPPIPEFDNERELLLAAYGRLGELRTISDYLSSWRVYNIDAVIAKQSAGGSEAELDRYGANIVPFVAHMLQETKIKNQLLNDLREAVPYIDNIQPDHMLTLQTLRFSEKDSGIDLQLPEMSDGTIRLLGLLAMLRQPVPPALVVIEEPENALHAYAVHHFLHVARQVAMSATFHSQLFVTSHSPAVVDEMLSIEAMQETDGQTACFVTQRQAQGGSTIAPAPDSVMRGIAQNLGRPSDFHREGSFDDQPRQLTIFAENGEP